MKKYLLLLLVFIGTSGAILHAHDKNQQLYDAITKKDRPKAIKLLNIDHANSNYITTVSRYQKTSVLIAAAKVGDSEVVKLLIDKGASLEWKDVPYNRTALMYAVAGNKMLIVELLLEEGADINANDGKGYTVLNAAKDSGDPDMLALIEDKIEEWKKAHPDQSK